VDYDKPGHVLHCQECDASQSDPSVGLVCSDCHQQTLAETAQQRTWYRYQLTHDGEQALYSGQFTASTNAKAGSNPLFRDFMLLTQSYAQIAIRCDRPLSALIFQLEHSPANSTQSMLHVADMIKEALRNGDLVTSVNNKVVALLPETNNDAAQISLTRLERHLQKKMSAEIRISCQILARGDILPKLRELQ